MMPSDEDPNPKARRGIWLERPSFGTSSRPCSSSGKPSQRTGSSYLGAASRGLATAQRGSLFGLERRSPSHPPGESIGSESSRFGGNVLSQAGCPSGAATSFVSTISPSDTHTHRQRLSLGSPELAIDRLQRKLDASSPVVPAAAKRVASETRFQPLPLAAGRRSTQSRGISSFSSLIAAATTAAWEEPFQSHDPLAPVEEALEGLRRIMVSSGASVKRGGLTSRPEAFETILDPQSPEERLAGRFQTPTRLRQLSVSKLQSPLVKVSLDSSCGRPNVEAGLDVAMQKLGVSLGRGPLVDREQIQHWNTDPNSCRRKGNSGAEGDPDFVRCEYGELPLTRGPLDGRPSQHSSVDFHPSQNVGNSSAEGNVKLALAEHVAPVLHSLESAKCPGTKCTLAELELMGAMEDLNTLESIVAPQDSITGLPSAEIDILEAAELLAGPMESDRAQFSQSPGSDTQKLGWIALGNMIKSLQFEQTSPSRDMLSERTTIETFALRTSLLFGDLKSRSLPERCRALEPHLPSTPSTSIACERQASALLAPRSDPTPHSTSMRISHEGAQGVALAKVREDLSTLVTLAMRAAIECPACASLAETLRSEATQEIDRLQPGTLAALTMTEERTAELTSCTRKGIALLLTALGGSCTSVAEAHGSSPPPPLTVQLPSAGGFSPGACSEVAAMGSETSSTFASSFSGLKNEFSPLGPKALAAEFSTGASSLAPGAAPSSESEPRGQAWRSAPSSDVTSRSQDSVGASPSREEVAKVFGSVAASMQQALLDIRATKRTMRRASSGCDVTLASTSSCPHSPDLLPHLQAVQARLESKRHCLATCSEHRSVPASPLQSSVAANLVLTASA